LWSGRRYTVRSTDFHHGGHTSSSSAFFAFVCTLGSLLTFIHHFKKNAYSQSLLEELGRNLDDMYSTQSKAFVLRALKAYYKGDISKPMKAELTYNAKSATYSKPISLHQYLQKKSYFSLLQVKRKIT